MSREEARMGLKIFGDRPKADPEARQSFADDVVGRFRSGYQVNDRPASLQAWRVTTGDPAVADEIAAFYGGSPQEWEAKGEDNIETFTEAATVDVIVERLDQRLVLWGRNNKPIYSTDGETKDDGTPDPDAGLTLAERKQKGRDGIGPVPQIEVLFRLAEKPDLGVFKFVSGSWSFLSDLDYFGVEDSLADADGKATATLGLTEVSFVAKNGPQAGKTVSYTKPVLKITGAAE
jgi:hypothetical protein